MDTAILDARNQLSASVRKEIEDAEEVHKHVHHHIHYHHIDPEAVGDSGEGVDVTVTTSVNADGSQATTVNQTGMTLNDETRWSIERKSEESLLAM